MALNSLIPLQAGNVPPINVPGAVNAANNMLLYRQNQQRAQAQNALRQVFAEPGALDKNGDPTPEAMNRVMAVDPQTGMALRQNMLRMASERDRQKVYDTQLYAEKSKLANDKAGEALSAYESALSDGLPEDQARKRGQEVYTKNLEDLKSSGLFSDTEVNNAIPTFDPARIRARVMTYQQQMAAREKQRQDQREDEKLDLDKQKTDLAQRKADFEMGVGGEAPAAPSDVHGADYLKTLDPSMANQVKALAEGRMQFPAGFALKSPYWQRMLQAVSNYDPSFDSVNYNARVKTRADFTSGASAKNITSFNTAIGHLGTLLDAGDALDNSSVPLWNKIANTVQTEKGDPRVVRFNVARQAVADELTRAFRGTGGNLAEIEEWQKSISSANSPAQLKAAIKQAVELLRSRIDALGEQYQRGMGTTADVMDLLTPKAKETLAKLPGGKDMLKDEGGAAKPDKTAAADKGDALPKFGPNDEAKVKALPKGTRFIGYDGNVYIR